MAESQQIKTATIEESAFYGCGFILAMFTRLRQC